MMMMTMSALPGLGLCRSQFGETSSVPCTAQNLLKMIISRMDLQSCTAKIVNLFFSSLSYRGQRVIEEEEWAILKS